MSEPVAAVKFSQIMFTLPRESTAICGLPPVLERFLGAENVRPPSLELVKRMAELLEVISFQTTLILPPESTASCGKNEKPALLERFLGIEKVTPPLLERLKKISELPGVSSSQITLMLPLASTAMCGSAERPASLERFLGVEKATPPSVERLKKISALPTVLSSQTTLMLPLESSAIFDSNEKPALFERSLGTENVTPPSVERLKKISRLPGVES